jgi:hypothetical protein
MSSAVGCRAWSSAIFGLAPRPSGRGHGTPAGLAAPAVFFLALALTLPPLGLVSFAIATLAALITGPDHVRHARRPTLTGVGSKTSAHRRVAGSRSGILDRDFRGLARSAGGRDLVGEVGRQRRAGGVHRLQANLQRCVVEEASASPQNGGHEMKAEFLNGPRSEVLAGDDGSAADHHVVGPGGLPRADQGGVDAFGDEYVRRAASLDDRLG